MKAPLSRALLLQTCEDTNLCLSQTGQNMQHYCSMFKCIQRGQTYVVIFMNTLNLEPEKYSDTGLKPRLSGVQNCHQMISACARALLMNKIKSAEFFWMLRTSLFTIGFSIFIFVDKIITFVDSGTHYIEQPSS